MTPTRLLVVRHGQSTWNADGRWQGQADPPLSALGEQQAAEAATRLRGVGAVWTSDLARARRTADVIADALGVAVHSDERLRERHAGPWQGLTRDEIDAQWPDHLATGARPEGYEADESILERSLAALDDIARAHPREQVVVVTHGGIVRALERRLGAADDGLIPNLSGRRIVGIGDGSWQLDGHVALLGDDTVTVPGQI